VYQFQFGINPCWTVCLKLISEGEGSTQNPHKNDGKQNLQFLKHHQIIDTNIDAKG